MKRYQFFLGIVFSPFCFKAQISQKELAKEFKIQALENYNKLNHRRSENKHSSRQEEYRDLAGFIGHQPFWLAPDDAVINQIHGVTKLQTAAPGFLQNKRLNGQGIEVLSFDLGLPRLSHREFSGRVKSLEGDDFSKTSHATQVAGVLIASGKNPRYKGVLPQANLGALSYQNTALGDRFTKMNSFSGRVISNHSYGTNNGWVKISRPSADFPEAGWYWTGDYELHPSISYASSYTSVDANYDKIAFANPRHSIIKSNGNYYGMSPEAHLPKYRWSSSQRKYIPFTKEETLPQPNCANGFYCIGSGSLAKNIIGVAAVKAFDPNDPSRIERASYSSIGPRKDGAIKPDMAAIGDNVHLTNDASDTAYTKNYGSSFAAPILTGIIGLMNEYVQESNPLGLYSDEAKAILIHTSIEAGTPGPDPAFGWGIADAVGAIELLSHDAKPHTEVYRTRPRLENAPYSYEFVAGSQPIKASIVWIDPPATPFQDNLELLTSTASRLVNDLDLRIIDTLTGQVYQPWKLDLNNLTQGAIKGDNSVDNVEQVIVDTPVEGRKYRLEVSSKTPLSQPQDFSLIISGKQDKQLSSTQPVPLPGFGVYTTGQTLHLSPSEDATEIGIYSGNGRLFHRIKAKKQISLDTSDLPKGVYIIIQKRKNATPISAKFIK